jgi:hypothetical protein
MVAGYGTSHCHRPHTPYLVNIYAARIPDSTPRM